MKNIFLVAKREFLTQVKKKSFLILTILMPLLIAVFMGVIWFMFKANTAVYSIDVIDKSGMFERHLGSDEEVKYIFNDEKNEQKLRKSLEENEGGDGLLIIPKIENENLEMLENEVQFLINKNANFSLRNKIIDDISDVLRNEKIQKLGIDKHQINDLSRKINLQVVNVVEKDKSENDMVVGVKTAISGVMTYIVFMFIMTYGMRVMRSVLEEKNNRVVEIIVSSVKPFDLMMGKILGVTGVALVQYLIWILMGILGVMFLGSKASVLPINADMAVEFLSMVSQIDYGLLLGMFFVYFLLGYLFYSAMYAAIGSAVDSEADTQQFMIFALLPMILGMYGGISIMQNPDGPMSFWLSMIPFTSPIAMLARMPFGVPTWELALSITMLILSVLAMIFIAAKIYRVGILMYGNKVSWKELLRWMRN